jgi:hypothetical protein
VTAAGFGGGRQVVKDKKSSGGKKTTPPVSNPPLAPLVTPESFGALLRSRGITPSLQQTPPPASNPAAAPAVNPEFRALLRNRGITPSLQQTPPPAKNAPMPARRVSLAGCHVTEVREIGEIERFLSEERKTYENNSKSATVTKELSVSNSIVRTVTIETSELKGHNAQAGVTLFGFAQIQGTLQQQLNQRYSVATQSSVSISEKTSIQIPPATVIEHVIRWKLISLNGLAFLGKLASPASSLILAEVPYQVPLRLTYTDAVNDVEKIPKISGHSRNTDRE